MTTLVLNADGLLVSYLPVSMIPWQEAIKATCAGVMFPIMNYEGYRVNSAKVSMQMPSILVTRDYVKPDVQVRFSRYNIFMRDGFACQYCGAKFTPSYHRLTFDHVVPKSMGGKTNWENITTACAPCNSAKGDDHRIVPKVMPRKPTYWALAAKRKTMPITIPDERWIEYLDWKGPVHVSKSPGFNPPLG